MTFNATFLNDFSNKPEIYIGRSDLNTYTLAIASDTPVTATDIRIVFPSRIFTASDVGAIHVETAGWNKTVQGNTLIVNGSETIGNELVIKLSGVASSVAIQTNDNLGVRVNGQNISPPYKIFLLKYSETARDMTQDVLAQLLPIPANVYITPSGNSVMIENQLVLQLTNRKPKEPLVTKEWVDTPTVQLSFVYGDDIGSLTTADDPNDPFTAWKIKASVEATYEQGQLTFEWDAWNPDPGSGGTNPIWTFKPVMTNREVLGYGSGATASFLLEAIATRAPEGTTLAYVQYSNFPGYNDGYFALSLQKQEPRPSIIFFNAVPSNLADLNEEATLSWQCFDIQQVKLQFDGKTLDSSQGEIESGVNGVATYKIKLGKTTQFTLNAYRIPDSFTPDFQRQVTINVPPVQIAGFDASAYEGTLPAAVDLTWQTSAALSAQITAPGQNAYKIPQVDLNTGTHKVFPQKPISYTLTVQGQGGPLEKSVDLFFLKKGWTMFQSSIDFSAPKGPLLLAVDKTLWLMSTDSEGAIYNSQDGQIWTQVAIFPDALKRSWANGVYWKNKFWIMGGDDGALRLNDVWSSSDGMNWTLETANAAWHARSNFGCVIFKDKLWVMGGLDQNYQASNDIWNSEDGSNWTKVGQADWSPRSDFGLAASEDILYVFAGKIGVDSLENDFWKSRDGMIWEQEPHSRAAERANPIVFAKGQTFYAFGGVADDGTPLAYLESYSSQSGWGALPGIKWGVCYPGYTIFRGGLWIAGGTSEYDSESAGQNNNVYTLKL
jgi:hypothetical protein